MMAVLAVASTWSACTGRRVVGNRPDLDAGPQPDRSTPSGEVCFNGLDDNGDGLIDDGCLCTEGETQRCWPATPSRRGIGACEDGRQTCTRFGEFVAFGDCVGAVLPTAEVPNNGVDEDCDGRDEGGGACEPDEVACDDGNDEDCDGRTDCADEDCAAVEPCASRCAASETSCDDGLDDDCDGDADCLDADCDADPACDSPTPPPGCTPEFPFFAELRCGDGADNDCDGDLDCGDADCRRPGTCGCDSREGSCDDGVDQDCDGDVDCADVDCQRCVPGTVRYCDFDGKWGTQTCTDAERWGTCWEVFGGPSGCGGSLYSASCCVDAGECCENVPTDAASVGPACGERVSCLP